MIDSRTEDVGCARLLETITGRFYVSERRKTMSRDINALLKTMNYQTKRIEAIYYKIALNLKMSESEFWILYALAEAEQECSQQEISEELSISRQTINSAIQSLMQREYVFLEQSSISVRRKNVRMTEKGKRFVKESIVPLQEAEREAFLKMGSFAQNQYVTLSQKYAANLQAEIERNFPVT